MTRTLAMCNQKGGVGKTTTTLSLAAAVADAGGRALCVDMDPQANLSQTLLPDLAERAAAGTLFTTNDLMELGTDPADTPEAIVASAWPGVDVICAEQVLANREAEGSTGIETRLRRALRGVPDGVYDAVLIDCPPSLSRLTVNALLAASEVVLVCEPDSYGQKALEQITTTLGVLAEAFDHRLVVRGVVVNGFEHTVEAQARTAWLADRFGDRLLAVIPKRTAIAAAAGAGQSVFSSRRRDAEPVAQAFRDLAAALGLAGPAVVDLAAAGPALAGAGR